MSRWKSKFKWAVPFALLGIVGCDTYDVPHLAAQAAAGIAGSGNAAGAPLGYSSDFEKVCHELPGMSEVPALVSAEEYPLLVEFVKAQSSLLSSDKDRFLRAHARALKATNEDVMLLLDKYQKSQELMFFKRNVARFIHYSHPNPLSDLQMMLNKVMEVSEGSKCADAYLSHFYASFVRQLDPFADVTFGLTEKLSPDDTLLLQPLLPDETKNTPTTKLLGSVMLVTLPKFQSGPALDVALRTLEQGFTQQNYRVVLFDLRYSGGIDLKNLAQIRASATRGWGVQPIVIFTNRQTRGTAAVLTQQFSSHPNVLVIGTEDETYGYGRKLVQQSAILAPGLSPLTLTVGSELLQPPGLDPGSDGYRLQLDHDHLILREKDKSVFDKAIERTEQWAMQAPPGDLGPASLQTDPNANANNNSGDTPGASASLVADPNAITANAGQQAAGQVAPGDPNFDPNQQNGGAQPDPTAPPPQATGPITIAPPADVAAAAAKSDATPTPF